MVCISGLLMVLSSMACESNPQNIMGWEHCHMDQGQTEFTRLTTVYISNVIDHRGLGFKTKL